MSQEPDTTIQSKGPKEEDKNPYREILEYARTEITWVHSAYKFAASLVTVVFVVGIYFTYQSSKDMKVEMRDNLKAAEIQMQKRLEDQLAVLSRTVEERTDKEFKNENIHRLVEDKAKSRIEEIADPLIQGHVAKSIEPKIQQVEQKIEGIKAEIATANTSISELKYVSELTKTVIAAQSMDDRKAFNQLKAWTTDPNFSFKNEAELAWIKILDEHATLFISISHTVPWAEGVDPTKLSFEELKEAFQSAPANIRVGIVEYIWKTRQDIPKKDKMQFLVDTMKSDKSLNVVEYAGRFFQEESKQKIKPLAIDVLVDWWEKNKGNYEKAQ